MLRPYQTTAVEGAEAALTKSGSAVLQMPTGAGKTKAAIEIIVRHKKPVWFICHRQEIERQAAKAFAAAGIDFGIVSPRAKPDYDKPVQIVSVATLTRRMKDMPLPSLAIWDECHHVAAKSWSRIREQLNGAQNLGLTATPERLDGKGLSEWFGELVVGPSTRELIDAGWLSDFRYFAPSEPDLAGARLQAGDYRKSDLDKAMNTPVLIGDAIAEYQKNASGKRALVFCASVEASQELVRRFNDAGVPARHVDGTTPTEERDAAVEALASGEIKVLSNVEVFTEGFDLPAIDAVILLRPTKSLALFLQMIGRVLRKAEGKDKALIFDHAGLWLDHDWFDLPIEWSLDGGARERRLAGRKVGPRRCPECKEVRPARQEVCACGYEFPTGREIGEYDGVLRELRGVVPEGWERQLDFARRYECHASVVSKWIKRGMPARGTIIPVAEAIKWVEENAPRCPDDCETVSDFARFLKSNWTTVRSLVKAGMPNRNGFIIKEEAVQWLIKRASNRFFPLDVDNPDEYESQRDFSERVGVVGSLSPWIKRGIPHASNGWIHIKGGEAWVERMRHEGLIKYPPPDDGDKVIASELFRSLGLSGGMGQRAFLASSGLMDDRGHISKEAGTIWMKEHYRPAKIPPLGDNSGEFESWESFRARIKIGSFRKKRFYSSGLPCASNGWVHIQRGLEWVRDNTSISIPPEAWPVANDNQSEAKKAA